MNPEIIVSSITNVPTSFLKLNAKMTSGSMENQKKTDLILSFKWDCLWMAMASLYAAKLLPATRTSRQHCSRWKIIGSNKTYNIEKLRTDSQLIEQYKNATFYKERWIKEDGLEQRLIVTYSVKYQEYQKNIRNNQITRAQKLIEKNHRKLGKARQNDPRRFITAVSTTENGEVASESHYSINLNIIEDEARYDGLYAVCTNLEDNVEDIIRVNHRRWEIEESFRIMKSEFNARPVFHSNEEAIKAHFLICFLSLTIYRFLEKKLDNKYTVGEVIDTLKEMDMKKETLNTYSPNYIRTDLTDDLHEKFGFRTDYEIITEKNLKKICKQTKK